MDDGVGQGFVKGQGQFEGAAFVADAALHRPLPQALHRRRDPFQETGDLQLRLFGQDGAGQVHGRVVGGHGYPSLGKDSTDNLVRLGA